MSTRRQKCPIAHQPTASADPSAAHLRTTATSESPPTGGSGWRDLQESFVVCLSIRLSVRPSVRPSICLSVMLNPLNINCPSAQPTMEPLVQPLFQPSPLPSNVPSLCSAALTLPFSICSVSLQAQAQALQFFHMAPTH